MIYIMVYPRVLPPCTRYCFCSKNIDNKTSLTFVKTYCIMSSIVLFRILYPCLIILSDEIYKISI